MTDDPGAEGAASGAPAEFDAIADVRSEQPKVGDVLGGYELKWLVGIGGAGQVWLGEHKISGGKGAVKILAAEASPSVRKAFEAEARTVARLAHPHVVDLYASAPGYLVMAYVDGPNLARRLLTPLSARAAVRIATQIASALEYAHSQGVVHRDVKPENVVLDRAGTAYLTDFGLATLTSEGEAHRGGGTATYMPPDWRKDRPDPRDDQYALGRTVAEMLLARRIDKGEALDDATLPRDCPEALRAAVLRAAAPRRDDRFPSVRAFADALAAVEVDGVAIARALAPPARPAAGFAWARAGAPARPIGFDVARADFKLSGLEREGGPSAGRVRAFREATGLAEHGWSVYGRADTLGSPDDPALLARAQEIVLFMPGLGTRRQSWDQFARHLCHHRGLTAAVSLDVFNSGDCRYARDEPEPRHVAPESTLRIFLELQQLLGIADLPTCIVAHSLTGYHLMALPDDVLGKNITRLAITPTLTRWNEAFGPHPLMNEDAVGRFTPEDFHRVKMGAWDAMISLLDAETAADLKAAAAEGLPLPYWRQAVRAGRDFRPAPGPQLRRLKIVVGYNDPLISHDTIDRATSDLQFDRSNLHWALDKDHFPHLAKKDHPEWTRRNFDQLLTIVSSMLLDASLQTNLITGDRTETLYEQINAEIAGADAVA
jgi:hypothetical protein